MPRSHTSSTVLRNYLNALAPLEHLLLDIPANQFNRLRQSLLTASLDTMLAHFPSHEHGESRLEEDLGKQFSVLEMGGEINSFDSFYRSPVRLI